MMVKVVRNRWGGRTFGLFVKLGRRWYLDVALVHRTNPHPESEADRPEGGK